MSQVLFVVFDEWRRFEDSKKMTFIGKIGEVDITGIDFGFQPAMSFPPAPPDMPAEPEKKRKTAWYRQFDRAPRFQREQLKKGR